MRQVILVLMVFCSFSGFACKPNIALSDLPSVVTQLVAKSAANIALPIKPSTKTKHTKKPIKIIIA